LTDSTEISSTTEGVFAGSNSTALGGEMQNIQAAYRLNGKNDRTPSILIVFHSMAVEIFSITTNYSSKT